MSHRWALPASRHSEAAACTWLQDEEGRFVGVESGGILHSVESGDLESFDPRRCSHCGEQAGWLPGVFEHCPLCGTPVADFANAREAAGDPHWPRLSQPGEALPVVGRPTGFDLPRGANFTFVRVPWRDRLVAIAGDSGRVWVYSRPGKQWRPLVSAPTGYPDVPPAMFGAVSVGGLLVYPTARGAVWIDTSPVGPARVEVSEWQPMGAPALLGGRVLIPVGDPGGQVGLASRGPGDREWHFADVTVSPRNQSARNPPPAPGKQWLARPVVEEDQVHWPGSDGLLFCDEAGAGRWACWQEDFVPVLGPPPLETRDGRFWQIGHARDDGGELSWAYASLAVNAAPECQPVKGAFFSAGRLCFRLDTRHLDPPWQEASWNRQEHRLPADSFLVPMASIGAQGALLLCLRDRSVTSELLQGDKAVRGELFMSRMPGHVESLQAVLSYHGHRRPQVFAWRGRLFVYDPVDAELDTWPLDVPSSEVPYSNGVQNG